jgi:hypothetical protein
MVDNGVQLLERPAIAVGDVNETAEPMQHVSQSMLVSEEEIHLPLDFGLGTLGDGRFRVLRPLRVQISTENEDYIANASDIDEFGYGSSRAEAIRDLQRTIVALYLSLEADEERLGPDLRRILQALRERVQRVR